MMTASLVLGKDLEKVSKEERIAAKAINFGLIYGQGASGLVKYAATAYNVRFTISDAERYRENFFRAYPAICQWHQKVEHQLCYEGEIRTVSGWRRDFKREATDLKEGVKGALLRTQRSLEITKSKLEIARVAMHNHSETELSAPVKGLKQGEEREQAMVIELEKRADVLSRESGDEESRLKRAHECHDLSRIPRILARPGRKSENFLFQAFNVGIQGSGAELMVIAMRRAYDAFKGTNVKLLNVIHDELVCECDEANAADVVVQLQSSMTEAFLELFPDYQSLTIGLVEVGVGDTWADAK